MDPKLITAARLLMGAIYLINGFNWWFKIITPYPSISDFVHYLPPSDIVGAMIDSHLMFHLVKATELVAGLALLTNRFVPLMLVAALPVTVPVFLVDVFTQTHLRGIVVGTTSLFLNVFLLAAYLRHYQAMLSVRGEAHLDPQQALLDDAPIVAKGVAAFARPVMPALGVIAAALGVVTLIWLLVMIGQYILNPAPLSSLHPLVPR